MLEVKFYSTSILFNPLNFAISNVNCSICSSGNFLTMSYNNKSLPHFIMQLFQRLHHHFCVFAVKITSWLVCKYYCRVCSKGSQTATLCCSPPLSWSGLLLAFSKRPNCLSMERAFFLLTDGETFLSSRGSSTFSKAVILFIRLND